MVVVYGDSADLVECILWYDIGVVSWITLIYLSRSGTIGQDEVKTITCTIFKVVFKANEGVKDSTLNHFINLSLTWKEKLFFAFRFDDAYYLRQPDEYLATDLPYPLSYSPVKKPVKLLKRDDLLIITPKSCNEHKAL